MPTILRINGYRFFFYSNDHAPIHIHVEKGNSSAKFNVIPVDLVNNYGFRSKELSTIKEIININQELLLNKWNEYFSNN
jgi:hypothetical protein